MLKNFLWTSCAAIAFAMGISVASAEDNTAYYSGEYICDNVPRNTEWKITKLNNNEYSGHIYTDNDRHAFILKKGMEVNAVAKDGKLVVFSKEIPFALVDLTNGDDVMETVWVDNDGRPRANCSSFEITKQPPAKDRWDQLLSYFSMEKPTNLEVEQKLKLRSSLTPLELLPAEERATYLKRVGEVRRMFWGAYFKNQTDRLLSLPIETEEDRKALIEEMRIASSLGRLPSGLERLSVEFLRITTDRLASTDTPVTPFSLDTACERFAKNSHPKTEEIELMVGLPTDYWGRDLAEQIIQKANECKHDRLAAEIKRSHLKYEANQRAREWAVAEIARLQALPETIEAFREANWFIINRETARKHGLDTDAYKRHLAGLQKIRDERIDLAISEIKKAFDTDSKTMTYETAVNFCRNTLGNNRQSGGLLSKLFEACYTISKDYVKSNEAALMEEHTKFMIKERQKQLEFQKRSMDVNRGGLNAALIEIDEAFNRAVPGEESERKAVELCKPSAQWTEALGILCSLKIRQLNKKREEMQ